MTDIFVKAVFVTKRGAQRLNDRYPCETELI